MPFFQISLKNSELKTTHNTFRDWHGHFFRQPFSKQLYTRCCLATDGMSNIVPRSPGCLSVNGEALAKQLDTFPSTTLVSNVLSETYICFSYQWCSFKKVHLGREKILFATFFFFHHQLFNVQKVKGALSQHFNHHHHHHRHKSFSCPITHGVQSSPFRPAFE